MIIRIAEKKIFIYYNDFFLFFEFKNKKEKQ